MRSFVRSVLVLVLVLAIASAPGCSSGSFELAGQPSDPGDAASTIDALADAPPGDTGSIEDSGEADATGDAGPDRDGGALDGGPPDAAPACPAPDTTATFDASSLTCDALPGKYAHYLREAKRCTCDADCRVSIARDFCGCGTFVNPGQSAYAALKAMRKQWDGAGCDTICPAIPCASPMGAKCVPTVDGKLCTDL